MDDTKAPYVLEPHPHDILTVENGEKVQANHKGNVYFLKLLVSDYNDKFKESDSTTTSSSATESARRVIKKIQSQNPPGRFLKEVYDRKETEEKPRTSSQISVSTERATTTVPKSKTRWEIMSPEQSIKTSLIYFKKVKDELERHRQKEDNRKKRTNDREHQQKEGGKNKKAKTTSQTDAGIPYERKPVPLQGCKKDHIVIDIDIDESIGNGNDVRTISNDSCSLHSLVVSPYISFEKIFLPCTPHRFPLCHTSNPNCSFLERIISQSIHHRDAIAKEMFYHIQTMYWNIPETLTRTQSGFTMETCF
jgi:hypothetical protein